MGPALAVSGKSVRLVAGNWGIILGQVTLKTLKIVFAAFAPGARHKRKCDGFVYMCCSSCMSFNSVQSFVINNCNGPIENGLNIVCLHPLSRTFTFILKWTSLRLCQHYVVYLFVLACSHAFIVIWTQGQGGLSWFWKTSKELRWAGPSTFRTYVSFILKCECQRRIIITF